MSSGQWDTRVGHNGRVINFIFLYTYWSSSIQNVFGVFGALSIGEVLNQGDEALAGGSGFLSDGIYFQFSFLSVFFFLDGEDG